MPLLFSIGCCAVADHDYHNPIMRLPTEYELVASVRSLLCDHLAIAAAVELSQFTSHAPDGDLRFICLAIATYLASIQHTHQLAYTLCAQVSPRIATPID